MRQPGTILLVACYELGHQPLSLASPLAVLRRAGFSPAAVDTSVSELSDEAIAQAQLVAISAPMHTALRLGTHVAARVRRLNPGAHICFYGLYATLNAEYLLRTAADSVIGGEYEEALLALAEAVDGHAPLTATAIPGVRTREHQAAPVLRRLDHAVPERSALPRPQSYAYLVRGDEAVPAGYVEASRGCLHTCAHCPITPVYGGRFFVIPRPLVLEDIRAQVRAGVRHITFGDPDFLNGPRHSLEIARALHAEFPHVTFDATIKVEHILERREVFPELASLGCIFVVAAVESLSEGVLRHLKKGHSRDNVVEALRILDDAGIPMRPTFVAFTPWTTARDYLEVLDFIAEHDLIEHVDPIQYAIRLLVPPGSALLDDHDGQAWLGPLDEEALSYTWQHPDPRMDALQREVQALVERAASIREPIPVTFTAIHRLASERLDAPIPALVAMGAGAGENTGTMRRARRPVPHLSEPWFC
ncbi:MAG TPA: CUAEP/CCAEP-tail radical SAM protein [Ktedonobacterales bacterium]|nr:CUAEP/CCAEP-tail radical SAM protein [Ktedonobacterales bacterium]